VRAPAYVGGTMHEAPLSEELEVAVRSAQAAGALLRSAFGGAQRVRHKGEIDLVTEADEQAESLIAGIVRGRFPDDQLLAEEGTAGGADSSRIWIVDPLDGTTNFAHGYPCFAVSIALEISG